MLPGLRTAGPNTLIQAEREGRVTALTISGDRAEVRVVKDGFARPAGVTFVGDSVLVLVEHGKLDELRETQWTERVKLQQEQIRLLNRLLDGAAVPELTRESRLQ